MGLVLGNSEDMIYAFIYTYWNWGLGSEKNKKILFNLIAEGDCQIEAIKGE